MPATRLALGPSASQAIGWTRARRVGSAHTSGGSPGRDNRCGAFPHDDGVRAHEKDNQKAEHEKTAPGAALHGRCLPLEIATRPTTANTTIGTIESRLQERRRWRARFGSSRGPRRALGASGQRQPWLAGIASRPLLGTSRRWSLWWHATAIELRR